MNVIREIERINETELENGLCPGMGKEGSWHDEYKDSAWVYVGGLDFKLTEGDIICFMSEWGEVEDINLVREKTTGKSKGFAFVKYVDQRSTILAVDNFTGAKLLGRTLRVDHVKKYRLPKEVQERHEKQEEGEEEQRGSKYAPGHAYEGKELESVYDLKQGPNLFLSVKEMEKQQKKLEKKRKKQSRREKES